MIEVAWGLITCIPKFGHCGYHSFFSTHFCAATILRVAKFQQQWLFTWTCIGKEMAILALRILEKLITLRTF